MILLFLSVVTHLKQIVDGFDPQLIPHLNLLPSVIIKLITDVITPTGCYSEPFVRAFKQALLCCKNNLFKQFLLFFATPRTTICCYPRV